MNGDGFPLQMNERHQSRGTESILWPALQVGAFSGTSGLLVGGVSGVLRSTTPTLFALASGIQWFALGSTFWATRSLILHARDIQKTNPRDRISASCIAGGVAGGSTAALLRGRANILPGTIMFSLFGLIGQAALNRVLAQRSEATSIGLADTSRSESFWRRMAESKWTPFKMLSDEEYEVMLRERLLRVNAELAIIDEKIEKLREVPGNVGEQEKTNP